MKALLTITLACLLLASCTKETSYPFPLPSKTKYLFNLSTLKINGVEHEGFNHATLSKNDTITDGNWRWYGFEFSDSLPQKKNIYFDDYDDYGEIEGEITFECRLFGSKQVDYTFSGNGTWFIKSATGTLVSFNNGAGNITYKEIRYPIEEGENPSVEYQINMEGYSRP